jgi:hypothetical protein
VLQKISRRVIRKLRRLGYLEAGIDVPVATGYDPLLDNEPELARSMAASVRQRIAFGERAGEKVRRIGHGFGYEGEKPELKGLRCATVNGFSLHANTDVAAHRRDQLERLLRYTVRGAISLERLIQDASGDLLYRFRRPWSDGTTGIKLSALELIEKLAALVPPPHAHLVHYSGCLAPNSKLRTQVSSPHPVSRVWTARRRRRKRLIGFGRVCSGVSLTWLWRAARFTGVLPCTSFPPFAKKR